MSEVVTLLAVYDADGTIIGELSYFVGKRFGRAHCGLCDITHGLVRERDDWRRHRAELPSPFETFHRDDQPAAVQAASGGVVPVIAAVTTDRGTVVLLQPEAIDRCAGSPARLIDAIHAAAANHGLTWPETSN